MEKGIVRFELKFISLPVVVTSLKPQQDLQLNLQTGVLSPTSRNKIQKRTKDLNAELFMQFYETIQKERELELKVIKNG